MNTHHYHEFLAIDRPLTREEMTSLRRFSPRALISAAGFIEEYINPPVPNPKELLRHYFDAHVALNTARAASFSVRLPKESIEQHMLLTFEIDPILEVGGTPGHWLLTWSTEASDNEDFPSILDGSGWMARLVPIREELLRGDMRPLYISWLAAVTRGDMDEDELEPVAVSGLDAFTPAQLALADFLNVDMDLMVSAGQNAPSTHPDLDEQEGIGAFVQTLSLEDLRQIATQLLNGQTEHTSRSLSRRLRAWQPRVLPQTQSTLRSVRELWLGTKHRPNER